MSDFQNSAPTISPLVDASPTTIRTPWKGICGPFRCAESSCDLRFTVALVVVAPEGKTCPIFRIPPQPFHPLLMHHQLQLEHRGRVFVDLFDVLNSAVTSVLV